MNTLRTNMNPPNFIENYFHHDNLLFLALLDSDKQYEAVTNKKSTNHDHFKTEPRALAPIKRNEYESIYATPADIMIDDSFDNQIPSIHPINKQEFWNYVTNTPNEGFSKECKVNYQ